MKIAMVQLNPVVGDIGRNLKAVFDGAMAAGAMGADLAVFPEMCLTGYPPKDLLERSAFVSDASDALAALERMTAGRAGPGLVVGLPAASGRGGGKGLVNAAVLVDDGRIVHRHEKALLPNYDVFDEARYFDAGSDIVPVDYKGERLGISICEDAWNAPELFHPRVYDIDPISILAQKGATVMINVSASPYTVGKPAFRAELVCRHARRHKAPFVFVNQVGGNDELVFDGGSLFADAKGRLREALPAFETAIALVDTAGPGGVARDLGSIENKPDACKDIGGIQGALVLGTRDYVRKCGFEKVVVGLSGGIDSAVTLAIAVAALGAKNVFAVAMPSPYSSRASRDDAAALAKNFGVELRVVPIDDVLDAYRHALPALLEPESPSLTEENLQARIRGNILMAYSNRFGYLVLSTGNKSEMAVGYCTLYGDMSGGLAVISDVPKMTVYELAEWINRDAPVIPRAIIEKPPSAELRPGQTDLDTLPPYDVLDAILDLYVEDGLPAESIASRGFDRAVVDWVLSAVRRNEYKRRQAATGLKVTSKAFGGGRRFPIAARYDA